MVGVRKIIGGNHQGRISSLYPEDGKSEVMILGFCFCHRSVVIDITVVAPHPFIRVTEIGALAVKIIVTNGWLFQY